ASGCRSSTCACIHRRPKCEGTARGRKCCRSASARSRSARSSRSARTRCSRSSPTGTAPASFPGTTSTSWAKTRRSTGPNISRSLPPPVAAENKSATVRRVFDSVAERYDVMNDLMSLGLHRAWKAFAISIVRPRPGERMLDVATGSGDLAVSLCRRTEPGGEVWISDINRRMLDRGRDRLLDAGHALPAVQCDAEHLPFQSGTFDCITVGFGLRNMTHKDTALAEMTRVLKPGGRLV